MKNVLFFCFFVVLYAICGAFSVEAQNTGTAIKGRVSDLETGELLPFVTVVFDDKRTVGTSTDINGEFTIPSGVQLLTFSFIGYNMLQVRLDTIDLSQKVIDFKLQSGEVNLQEIVIVPSGNPANLIIKRVLRNKDINDPQERLHSYSYENYSKTTYDFIPKAPEEIGNDPHKRESKLWKKFVQRARQIADERHLLVMESVSRNDFIAPDHRLETVIANKVSGFNDPAFAIIPSRFKPFTLYTDFISLIDKDYVSPISKGSTKQYAFNIEDTLFTQSGDSVYILTYEPQRGKNFNGLKGILYINSNGYAVENIIAEPSDESLVYARMNQKQQKTEQGYWFPSEIGFEVIFENIPRKEVGMKINARSYISKVEINPVLDAKKFDLETLVLEEGAAQKDDTYWKNHRRDTLTAKEQKTYEVMGALNKKFGFDKWAKIGQKLSFGYFPLGKLDLDLNYLARKNDYEGYRLGIGLRTNEEISKRFTVGAAAGYGFGDKAWKYAGNVLWLWDKKGDYQSEIRYSSDVRPAASRTTLAYPGSIIDLRNYLTANLDLIEEKEVATKIRLMKYATARLSLNQNRKIPTYNYSFQPDLGEPDLDNIFHFTDVAVQLRYAYKENFIESFGQRVSLGTPYPILYFTYTQGLKDVLEGEYAYNKYEAAIAQTLRSKYLGITRLHVEGGYINGSVPYSNLFLNRGNFSITIPFFVERSFQTMRTFEFLSDRYVNIFITHNFETRLVKGKYFRPEIEVSQNISFGTLSNAANHVLDEDVNFKTLEKGYFEAGLMMRNLLRFNFYNVAYFGIGGGVFYRYGAYHFADEKRNIAGKISLMFSLN